MATDINANAKHTHCTTCSAHYDCDAKYCGVDGTALLLGEGELLMPNPAAAERRCSSCSTKYPGYARYCAKDGSELLGMDKTSAVVFKREEDEVIGKTLAGKYRVERLLGEGGMAKVYSAVNAEIEKQVVIKLMRQSIPSREKDTTLKRFLQEIKVTAKLNHPNLVSVFDGGQIDGHPFLVMEYIDGGSLRDYIAENTFPDFTDAITIISQACAGLEEAHKGGIIHRDLKPENIMLRRDSDRPDWVKVVDFGIAHLKHGGSKLTATGIAIGTVDYMSPEYLADKPTDHRVDIYALGVILFEVLTGRCPFEAQAAEAVMMKHLYTSPMPPSSIRTGDMDAGCALDRVVEKALAKDPDERYQSVADMRRALQKALANPNKSNLI